MNGLFEKTRINGMTLENRFVRSATWTGRAADDGSVTPELIEMMADLAKGGLGLIISGHSYVSPEGQAGPRQLGVYEESLIPGLERMVTAVHEAGGKMVLQLAHAGNFAAESLTGQPPWVVSDFEGLADTPRREMRAEDIQSLVRAFAEGARRAKAAGFDGVQIHAAHGYLLSQFLSPRFNRRADAYGGDIGNRSQALLEVYQAVRETVGPDYPVLIKINCEDFVEDGLGVAEAIQAAKRLADAGLDAIELSGGLLINKKRSPSRVGIKKPEQEAYFQKQAKAFKAAIPQTPLMLVGGIRSPRVCRQLIQDGVADYLCMSRPLIREPGLISRWKAGDTEPARCVSDNLCFKPGFEGQGIYCLTEEREQQGSAS